MPSSPVTVVRVPCIDWLTAVTVTPGSAAPVSSVTLPLIAPVVELTVWAQAPVTLTRAKITPTATTFPRLMVPPPSQDKLGLRAPKTATRI